MLSSLLLSMITMTQILIGIVMVIAGVYQVIKNLISHDKSQTNWILTVVLVLVGCALALSSGWNLLDKAVTSSSHQLEEWIQGKADEYGEFNENPFDD